MEVVEQPLGVGADTLALPVDLSDRAVDVLEDTAVLDETPQQGLAGADRRPDRGHGEFASPAVEMLQAE